MGFKGHLGAMGLNNGRGVKLQVDLTRLWKCTNG